MKNKERGCFNIPASENWWSSCFACRLFISYPTDQKAVSAEWVNKCQLIFSHNLLLTWVEPKSSFYKEESLLGTEILNDVYITFLDCYDKWTPKIMNPSFVVQKQAQKTNNTQKWTLWKLLSFTECINNISCPQFKVIHWTWPQNEMLRDKIYIVHWLSLLIFYTQNHCYDSLKNSFAIFRLS